MQAVADRVLGMAAPGVTPIPVDSPVQMQDGPGAGRFQQPVDVLGDVHHPRRRGQRPVGVIGPGRPSGLSAGVVPGNHGSGISLEAFRARHAGGIDPGPLTIGIPKRGDPRFCREPCSRKGNGPASGRQPFACLIEVGHGWQDTTPDRPGRRWRYRGRVRKAVLFRSVLRFLDQGAEVVEAVYMWKRHRLMVPFTVATFLGMVFVAGWAGWEDWATRIVIGLAAGAIAVMASTDYKVLARTSQGTFLYDASRFRQVAIGSPDRLPADVTIEPFGGTVLATDWAVGDSIYTVPKSSESAMGRIAGQET